MSTPTDSLAADQPVRPTHPRKEKGKLLQVLGVGFGIAVAVGNSISVGIVRTPGDIAARLPNVWLFIAVWIGGAFYAEGKGYGGPMQVLVGIDSQGKVLEVLLLSHKETLGLWTKSADQEFRAQFRGKTGPFILKRDNSEGNLDGVTSATVTCRAIIAAVEEALRTFKREWGIK